MGVTQLWNILEPVKRQGDLALLKGKTLCVDLSGWICEAQGSKGLKANVLKPHLRNLFFRVWNLTRVGVKLVFVVDGDAPEVKWEAIVKRNEARHAYDGWGNKGRGRGRGRGVAKGQRKKVGRSNFRIWVNECTTLLQLLGIPYVESAGEAEALCAWMDANRIVDGCITNDGDAFLYGARTVYKDLCISNKECTMGFYCMDDVETKICLNREKLVSLAILLGCDYLPQGVPGVGKEMGLKLVQTLQGVNLLQRFQDWSNFKVCEDDMSKIEKTVKQKASKVSGFPNEAVINEFMYPKLKTQHLTIPKGNKCPDVKGLQDFCLNYLEWPEDYTTEKILPLVTYWQMEKGMSVKHCNQRCVVTPERIVKARVQNWIECYEVLWKNNDIGDACQSTFVTIETRTLFGQVYPVLVEEFEVLQNHKKSKKSGKRKGNSKDLPNDDSNPVEELCNNLDALSLAVERDSLRHSTNNTKLNHDKQTAFSQDEMAETEMQNKHAGNPSLDDENIVHGSQEKQKKREPQQQYEEKDEQHHCEEAKYAKKHNLATKVQIGKKNSKYRENLKVRVDRMDNLLDSRDTSSENEMSDSLVCEFFAPLARRIGAQCPKNGRNVEIDIPSDADSVVTKNIKKSKEKKEIDNEVQVVLIESSEDEEERDVCLKSQSKENSRLKGQEELSHVLERHALEGASSRKDDTKTGQPVESGVEMTAFGWVKYSCARTVHEIHPLEKAKAVAALNGKEVKKEPGLVPLAKETIASGKMKNGGIKNAIEMKKEPINKYDERSSSSLPSNDRSLGRGGGSSAVSLSCENRENTGRVSSGRESRLHRVKNIRSNLKTKVMQRVYFSSDSSDDDDSWYVDSGNASDGGSVAAASGGGKDSWYVDSGNNGGGCSVAAASGGGNGSWIIDSGKGGGGSVAAAVGDHGGSGDGDDSWYVDSGNGGDGSVVAAASGGGDVGGDSWFVDSGNGGDYGGGDDRVGNDNSRYISSGGASVSGDSDQNACGGGGDDSWYGDNEVCGDGVVTSSVSGDEKEEAEETKSGENVEKPKEKERKMSSTKTMEKMKGKMSSSKLLDTKIPSLANDVNQTQPHQTHPKCTATSGAKIRSKLQNKEYNLTASQLKTKQSDFHIRQVTMLQSSTHEQIYQVCSSIDKHDKVSTPNSLEKTDEKENSESPLEDVFVPLSLSERLGRHLHGRRNVLSTLRTLSSN